LELGARIRAARRARGLTQEELARRAGMSLNGVASLEQGERKDPHFSTLSHIADALDTSIGELVGEEQAPKVQALSPPESSSADDVVVVEERRVLFVLFASWAHWAQSLRERMQKLLDGLPVLPDNKIVLADKRARIVELQKDFRAMQRTLVESRAAEAMTPYFLALSSGEYVPNDLSEELRRFKEAQGAMMMTLGNRGGKWISQAEEAIKAAPKDLAESSQEETELSQEVNNWMKVSS
jgi:transcriptional regulator with XRE-family HTH domain